ncbi:hypothetical protein, partial [Sporisorium scitamineum]
MKYLSALALAFAASITLASAGPEAMVAIPPGQGRSTRGVRSVITGHKIRSHVHRSRRHQLHHDDDLHFDRRFSNATLNADEEEVVAMAAAHKKRNTCSPKSAAKATANYRVKGGSSSSSSASTSQWKLVKSYSGSSFFDDMDFYTNSDPTHGSVTYVDQNSARNQGLIYTNNGKATMKITANNGWAQSVRINTKDSFTTGIFVL